MAMGVAALSVPGLAVLAVPAQAAAPTVVSLTFDDGNADQLNAAQIMNNYGIDGTFYIASGVINTPNYLTVANLQGLELYTQPGGRHLGLLKLRMPRRPQDMHTCHARHSRLE